MKIIVNGEEAYVTENADSSVTVDDILTAAHLTPVGEYILMLDAMPVHRYRGGVTSGTKELRVSEGLGFFTEHSPLSKEPVP